MKVSKLNCAGNFPLLFQSQRLVVSNVESAPGLSVIKLICSIWGGCCRHRAHFLLGPDRAAGSAVQKGFVYQMFLSPFLSFHISACSEGTPGLSAGLYPTFPCTFESVTVIKITGNP